MLVTASETGLLPHQFWRMTPLSFYRHVAGYRRREENEWDRWRRTFAQNNNVNATKQEQLLTPVEVMALPRDEITKGKPVRRRLQKKISRAEFERLWRMANTTPPPPED